MAPKPLDRTSPVPLYFQISERIYQAIESGALRPGERLDNEVVLGAQLRVSRPTVRQAIQCLVEKGVLVRRRGVGTVVVHQRIRRPIALTSLYDDLEAAGRNPTTRVLAIEEVAAEPEVAGSLMIEVGSPVLRIERLRCADEMPLAVMRNDLPTDLLTPPLDAGTLQDHGLYQLLRANGVQLHAAHEVIGARTATRGEAELLRVARRTTVLTMTRTAHDPHGRAIELGQHVYLASRYSFELAVFSR